MKLEAADHTWRNDLNIGYRILDQVNGDKLRLFFLSLLWRAATTRLWEFEPFKLTKEEEVKLRDMILNGEASPYHFYPVMMTQLITKSVPHNLAGGRIMKKRFVIDEMSGELNGQYYEVPVYRFYFDGLVVHMHIDESPDYVAKMGSFFVGEQKEVLVTTFRSEDSRQMAQFWKNQQRE